MNTDRAALIEARELVPAPAPPEWPPLDFTVASGSLTCVVGPDGGGKTLLLRSLAGLVPLRCGELLLLGQRYRDLSEEAWLALRPQLAFVAAETPLISFYSGWRNLTFAALYHRIGPPAEIEARAAALARELGVEADLDLLPAYFDGLMQRKLVLIRALLLRPRVLFLDEPFRLLDALEAARLKRFLDTLRQRALAVVIATHDLNYVMDSADAAFYVSAGSRSRFADGEELRRCALPEVRDFLATIPPVPEGSAHVERR